MKRFIVGIDPGTTTGVALVGLDGKVVSVNSKKHWGLAALVEHIAINGRPSIIATDRRVAPSIVTKLAASFGVPVFSPEEDIRRTEKERTVAQYDLDDDHKKDALASALMAYNFFKNRIERVERRALRDDEADALKDAVIRGRIHNITEALRNV